MTASVPLLPRWCLGLLCVSLLLTADCAETTDSLDTTIAMIPSPSPADGTAPSPTGGGDPNDDNPLQEHLSLIIGVSIGLGVCVLFGIACFIWLGVSAYREYRANRPSSYHGTASSRLPYNGDTLPRSTGRADDTLQRKHHGRADDTLQRKQRREDDTLQRMKHSRPEDSSMSHTERETTT